MEKISKQATESLLANNEVTSSKIFPVGDDRFGEKTPTGLSLNGRPLFHDLAIVWKIDVTVEVNGDQHQMRPIKSYTLCQPLLRKSPASLMCWDRHHSPYISLPAQ